MRKNDKVQIDRAAIAGAPAAPLGSAEVSDADREGVVAAGVSLRPSSGGLAALTTGPGTRPTTNQEQLPERAFQSQPAPK